MFERARGRSAAVILQVEDHATLLFYEEFHAYGTSSYRAHDNAVDVSTKRYRYTGMERDEETGLGYHTARYYAPWLGRWTAADPIGLGDGVNRYSYVGGRPTSVHDLSGEAPPPESEQPTLSRATPENRKKFLTSVNRELSELDPESDRNEVTRRAFQKVREKDPSLAGLLPRGLESGKRVQEVRAGTLQSEEVFVSVRATTKSRAGARLVQRGDYDPRTGELRRSRPGQQLNVDVTDPLGFPLVKVDHDALFQATGGDPKKLREAILDQLSTDYANTIAHEFFHAQRRFRELGVDPAPGVELESPRQRALDRTLADPKVAERVETQNSKLAGHGEFVAEEAFAAISTFRLLGLPDPPESAFKRGYSVASEAAGFDRAINTGVMPIFREVQLRLNREADAFQQIQELMNDPYLQVQFALDVAFRL